MRFDNKLYIWLRFFVDYGYVLGKRNFTQICFINSNKFHTILTKPRQHLCYFLNCFILDYSSRRNVAVDLFPERHAIWRSNSPSTYFAVWRPTWITNLKNVLSQAFSVKLRAVALTSAMTIFSRTRHGQPGRLSCAHNTLASDILAIRRLNEERSSGYETAKTRGEGRARCLLRRIDLVQSGSEFFFFFSISSTSSFIIVFDEISERRFNRLVHCNSV